MRIDWDLIKYYISNIRMERKYYSYSFPDKHPVSEFETKLIDGLFETLEMHINKDTIDAN